MVPAQVRHEADVVVSAPLCVTPSTSDTPRSVRLDRGRSIVAGPVCEWCVQKLHLDQPKVGSDFRETILVRVCRSNDDEALRHAALHFAEQFG